MISRMISKVIYLILFYGKHLPHLFRKENRELIGRAGKVLRRNGMIAIEDYIRGRSPMAEMFAVNMLANTEAGNTYTEEEYKEWLIGAGFHNIEVIDIAKRAASS